MARYSRTAKPNDSNTPIGRVKIYDRIYMGFVKDNQDAQRMGRLRVWVPELGSLPDDKDGWITVSYVSPFAGATNPLDLVGNADRNDPQGHRDVNSQTSYGWWGVPPDLENQVLVFFINGDPARGVWFGCLYQQNMNQMVPGIAAAEANHKTNGRPLPVTEYNKKSAERYREDIQRPESTVQSKGIAAQGLINDRVRGVTDTSARRESPSEVYGFLTPGPKRPGKETKRIGGSSFYMDDGEGREHVRIRTKGGAQILLDETNGLIYVINRPGTAWMQMDAEGNVDIFGARSFSVRSQEDINLRADRDVNIEAGRNLNWKAAKDYQGGGSGNFKAPGDGSGGNLFVELKGSADWKITDDLSIETDGKLGLKSTGRIDVRTQTTLSMDGSIARIQQGAANPDSADTRQMHDKTTVLDQFEDVNMYSRKTNRVKTILTRMPTYEPCPEHNVSSSVALLRQRATSSTGNFLPSLANTIQFEGEFEVRTDDNFSVSLANALKLEGGFVDDPLDRGGPTKYGISLVYLRSKGKAGDINGDGKVDVEDIRALTLEQAEAFYKQDFWDAYGYDAIGDQAVAKKVFDITIHSGGARASRLVRQALNDLGYDVKDNGRLGAKEFAAMNEIPSDQLIDALRDKQRSFYLAIVERDPTQQRFLNGWLNRANT